MIRAIPALAVTVLLATPASAGPLDPLKPIWTSKIDGSFDTVVAPDKDHVWAFGHAGDFRDARPLVYRKSGDQWIAEKLPAGLDGKIASASASSPDNVWAVGYDPGGKKGRHWLVHWNGKRWRVAKYSKARTLSVVAQGKNRVWAFDQITSEATWFDGKRWHRTKTPLDVSGAEAYGKKTVWAEGWDKRGRSHIARHDGRRWRFEKLGTLLPSPEKALTLLNIPTVVGKDVWVSGSSIIDDTKVKPVLLHRVKSRWVREKIPKFITWGLERPTPDGRGGLWFVTGPAASEPQDQIWLAHRTPSGTWTRTPVGTAKEREVAIFPNSTVLIPGTQQFLAPGVFQDKEAAIFGFTAAR